MADVKGDAADPGARVALSSIPAASRAAVPLPGRRLGDEIAAARDYRSQAKAANTIRAYQSDWAQFEGWCDERGGAPLPVRAETVATYLAVLARAGKADSTIGRHLAAIGWKHGQDGLVAPTLRDARQVIADTLAGIRREDRERPSRRKDATSAQDLARMIAAADGQGIRVIRDCAVLGYVRSAELLDDHAGEGFLWGRALSPAHSGAHKFARGASVCSASQSRDGQSAG